MFTFGGDDDELQAAATETWARATDEDLDEDLAVTGVYVTDKAMVVQDGPDGPRPTVVLAGTLGRLAFVDPDPTTDEAFADLVERTVEDDFEAQRRELLGDTDDG